MLSLSFSLSIALSLSYKSFFFIFFHINIVRERVHVICLFVSDPLHCDNIISFGCPLITHKHKQHMYIYIQINPIRSDPENRSKTYCITISTISTTTEITRHTHDINQLYNNTNHWTALQSQNDIELELKSATTFTTTDYNSNSNSNNRRGSTGCVSER